jgi:hypothetical protein
MLLLLVLFVFNKSLLLLLLLMHCDCLLAGHADRQGDEGGGDRH